MIVDVGLHLSVSMIVGDGVGRVIGDEVYSDVSELI